jgi:thiol:disulfide interchange protein DsbD
VPVPATVPPAELSDAPAGDVGRIESALKGGRLLVIVPLFALLGLGLSFTPCVLPMVPILSSIIVGDGAAAKRSRGLSLSLIYSLGMALVYTALGVAAGLAGEGLAATLQNPWVLSAFALLMAGLSLSMFGVYELQVPSALQGKLAAASNQQASGKFAGVFAMGAISALIVGPCVAAPLAGALVYISQTRDVLIGGSALFAMAAGMSVPLILVGVSAGTLLPRAGAWMNSVKRFFGVVLLAVAWWLVSPVLPPAVQMLGWAALGLGYGVYLMTRMTGWGAKAAGVAFTLLGAIQLAGVATGGRDALAPLAHLRAESALPGKHTLAFKRIKTVAELDAVLAATGGKTAMLDFYADWCVSCKEMEKLTFVDPRVKTRLANTILLQVDVTANDADDKAMLKRFQLFGPPGIILFDAAGKEIPGARVIGYQNAEQFAGSLARLR